ncbi:MAG TPA: helix-turn-helix domain-containing protein [Tahibacter sp.]|uniref:TetR/AcrR family transcriptional regulator n=1 Tax=Tahibacter sp. TaxID=2056211 RepID=UPI002C55F2A8|nr:helix-turn-helix domain-containing protein [Tahibacter sp.]HSX62568.1 helix-turn-helix domain-containing protein [Tahibacter sp.]
MTHAKTDARALRSREALLDAFAGLLHQRGYERLTIQNVLDRAGVSRATFYEHFRNKDDLLANSVGRLRGWLQRESQIAAASAPGMQLGFTLPFFRHVRQAATRVHAPGVQLAVEKHMRLLLCELVRDELRAQPQAARLREAEIEAVVQHVAGALSNVLLWWRETRPELTPEQLDAIFRLMTLPGIAGVLAVMAAA